MLYVPRLASGKAVALTWPMLLYRWFNIICWPLEDNAAWWTHAITGFSYVGSFLIFIMHNEAELRYIYLNLNNLDDMLTGIPTYFVLIEIHVRAFTSGLKKQNFKRILRKFYAEIYIEETERPDIFRNNLRKYWPVLTFSTLYLCALASYISATIYYLSIGSRELLYKMTPSFDYRPLPIYVPLVLSNVWVGFIVAATIVGESYTLSMFVHNLNGRYQMMRENLNEKVDNILKTESNGSLALGKFNRLLVETLQENMRLNAFAREIQDTFSLRIFTIFSFLAAALCALGFKVYTSPMTSIPYIFWTVGKVQETIAFGQIGTSIITSTDGTSSMYYESNWESIVERSSDSKANVRLMKLIALAISINKKPFSLTGMNFFSVSLTSAVTIFQGAGSYFTCLISLR